MWENPMLEDVKVKEAKGEEDVRGLESIGAGYPELKHPGSYDEEDEEKRRFRETLITKEESLEDHLLSQLVMFAESVDYQIGEYIIRNLDDNGYLKLRAKEIARKFRVNVKKAEKVLSLIQTFDPAGIAARDLKDCLLIQLKTQGKEESLSYDIVKIYLKELEKKEYSKIARKLKVQKEDVEKAALQVRSLEPKPGRSYATEKTVWSIPDLILEKEEEGYSVRLNNRYLPKLRISRFYSQLMKNKKTDESTRNYLKLKNERAKWVVKAILQRQNTIKEIADFIINFQKDFLNDPHKPMRPLKLTDVAEGLSISQSTVSRTVAKKYIQTEFGIVPLKYFFSTALKQGRGKAVSAKFIKSKIKEIIGSENARKPLSDREISDILKKDNVSVARRTVAKYREGMKILPARLRKRPR
jgi:RNA polymerase sigma-54 factor